MKIAKVASMKPIDRFLYWITERWNIYQAKEQGAPKPWTDDKVLQQYWFTNPYRELDKTTVWFRETVRDPLRDDPKVIFATVAFRWFNLISTGQVLWDKGLLHFWDTKKAVKLIRELNEAGPVFTGAYMIKAGNGEPGCKIPNVCDAIYQVWKKRHSLTQLCDPDTVGELRLYHLWNRLREFKYLGGFMSYEIVCDLRYTAMLENAVDVNTWTNLGPGAARGLYRLSGKTAIPTTNSRGRQKPTFPVPDDWLTQMGDLLKICNERLPDSMPRFEMREVEHSLCEFDKYERARLGDGKMKRRYNGT